MFLIYVLVSILFVMLLVYSSTFIKKKSSDTTECGSLIENKSEPKDDDNISIIEQSVKDKNNSTKISKEKDNSKIEISKKERKNLKPFYSE